MAVPLLDLRAQYATIHKEVVAAIMRVVEDQAFILGPPVAQLEEQVAKLSGTRHAIGCANGTDALVLALRALDIGRGDEVVTTPFTFFATAGAVHNVGARPVFADIDPDTFNILPEAAAAAVTPATKAVMPVDLFGQLAPLEGIIAAIPDLPIIEDAAQSIGATREIDGRHVRAGEIATIGTFSFFPSKNLGGYGDGGMIVTQDEGSQRGCVVFECTAVSRRTSTKKSDTTAGSTRSRPRCCWRSCPIWRSGAQHVDEMRPTTIQRLLTSPT